MQPGYRVQYIYALPRFVLVNINTNIVSKTTENINRILKFAFVAAQNGERHAFLNLFPSTFRMSQGQEADTISPKKQEARWNITESIFSQIQVTNRLFIEIFHDKVTTCLYVPLVLVWREKKGPLIQHLCQGKDLPSETPC